MGVRHEGRKKRMLKKKVLAVAVCAMMALSMFGLVACGSSDTSSDESGSEEAAEAVSGTISVYSREDGSGTRDAFTELMGIIDDSSGEDVDMTTTSAVITNSTSVMMTSVAGDELGIGYISLGSLDDSVTAVTVDGIEATADNVKSGSYAVSRPFNIVVSDSGVSDVAQDFIDYIFSAEGQAVIEEEGYVAVDDAAASYESAGLSGKVTVAGSSSVTPVMEVLAEEYEALNADVSIEVQQSDSSTGITMTQEGTCDIGMASRDLKDEETGVSTQTIAMDGIAVIVNNDSGISALTSEQIQQIFTGEVTDWADVQ